MQHYKSQRNLEEADCCIQYDKEAVTVEDNLREGESIE